MSETKQQTTFGGERVTPILYRDGRPDPDQPCRWVGQTARPWCIVHEEWWASEGRCAALSEVDHGAY